MATHDIIVIGGSAGAGSSVKTILKNLPADLRASVFVVLHLDPSYGRLYASNLSAETALQVEVVEDVGAIRTGTVFMPRADHHLLVRSGQAASVRGPRENLWRPAIDVLFRSAAVSYNSRVIGILLSGELDDGTSGLQAIKACGGIAILQDPAETEFRSMLEIAEEHVVIDHKVRVTDIAQLVLDLLPTEAKQDIVVPPHLVAEVALVEGSKRRENPDAERPPSIFTCPECGGPLWELKDDGRRYRCLTGHGYHLHSLLEGSDKALEGTIWAAVRLFEQRVLLERRMADEEAEKGRDVRANLYRERWQESSKHAKALRDFLTVSRGPH